MRKVDGAAVDLSLDDQGPAECFDDFAQSRQFRVGGVFELGDACLRHAEAFGEFALVDAEVAAEFSELS